MGLKARYTVNEVRGIFDRRLKAIENAIIMRLMRLGEECVNNARTVGDYTDRTGNLRSSIGYVVMSNGKQVKSNFLSVGGDSGTNTAKSFAQQVAAKFSTGYALIVVAGMDYAFYVEATGRNVLSSAEHLAQAQLPIMMQQLKAKLK